MTFVYTYVGAKFNRFFIILGCASFSTGKLWDLLNREKLANFGVFRVKSHDFNKLGKFPRNFIISSILPKFNKFVISGKLGNFKIDKLHNLERDTSAKFVKNRIF